MTGIKKILVPTALLLVVLHEVKVPAQGKGKGKGICASQHVDDILDSLKLPVEAVESVPEEQSHEAICPSVRSKKVKNP